MGPKRFWGTGTNSKKVASPAPAEAGDQVVEAATVHDLAVFEPASEEVR